MALVLKMPMASHRPGFWSSDPQGAPTPTPGPCGAAVLNSARRVLPLVATGVNSRRGVKHLLCTWPGLGAGVQGEKVRRLRGAHG